MAQERNRVVKDGLLLLITLAFGLSCYGYFYNRGLGLPVIGYSLAPAERVLQGELPYRDFLYDYGPGVLWINALLMKLLGVTLMASRIGLFGFKVATLIMVAFVSRRLTSALAALVPVALMIAWPGYGQVFNVHPDQYFVLFALTGLAFMLQYDKRDNNKWLALCGVTAGLIFLFKYSAGILFLTAGALIVVTRARATEALPQSRSKTVKATAIYVAGFAVVAAPFTVYLIYNHALGAIIHNLIFHAAAHNDAESIHLRKLGEIMPLAVLLVPAIGAGLLLLIGVGRVFPFYAIATMIGGSVILIQSYRGKVLNSAVVTLVTYCPPLIFLAASIYAIWRLKKANWKLVSWWKRNGAITIAGLFAFAIYSIYFRDPTFITSSGSFLRCSCSYVLCLSAGRRC